MRLMCVGNKGENLDIETALEQEPYETRGLLVDAFFQCQQHLSDSFNFIPVERGIRDALLGFEADKDRHIRSYMLSRTMDSRVLSSPRTALLGESLKHGGPLALIWTYYATIDAHRNTCNREVLHLLVKFSLESKHQLFARIHKFPCNPSINNWLLRILGQLDLDTQNLASILRCLGSSSIPMALFRRVWEPSRSWGEDGVVETRTLTVTVSSEKVFASALYFLEYVGFVRVSGEQIDLDRRISEFLQGRFEQPTWVADAVRIMAHAFPIYRSL
ncbi:uncharacterized protein GGS25DRAFT_419821 [Hypoxylon fragiforme]|uniref:uncharacterized protein n=1 Tax=Hypoxylon fragiforme TaxID=63214 RepID=UPI0020C5CD9D|nr:uncharacterized protein GGS25DRAFT_419821 [Hypoxylon fragiforme]KAI2605183.1 hypothetical protein GGS25DRAFT_419821 [Hypoxylon fragiforme]